MGRTKSLNLRHLIFASLLIALDVVTLRMLPGLVYYLPLGTFLFRLSPTFLWYGLAGWITGPGWAMAMAMCSDLIGVWINPTGTGTVYPGYTITAGLSALCYGLFLFGRKPNLLRSVLAVFSHVAVVGVSLTSLWNVLLGYYPDYWTPFWLALPWRLGAVIPLALLQFGLMIALEKPYESLKGRFGRGTT